MATILVPIIALAALSIGRSATVISDTFALNDGARVAGTQLNGLTTEDGGLPWLAGTNWLLAGDSSNGYIKSNANTSSILNLAFTPSTYASYGSNITISANVAYIKSSGSYFDLGFSKANNTPSTNGLIYLQIYPSGDSWKLMNDAGMITSGVLSSYISSYSATTFYNYSISYDTSANLVDISINGNQVLTDFPYTISSSAINDVFIWNQSPGTTSMVDGFSVDVVPEVSSAHLLLLGLFVLGMANRKIHSARIARV